MQVWVCLNKIALKPHRKRFEYDHGREIQIFTLNVPLWLAILYGLYLFRVINIQEL